MGHIVGCAPVSTSDQDFAGQEPRVRQTGAAKMFTDIRSALSMNRPWPGVLREYACSGDPQEVVRLGRALAEFLATVAVLHVEGARRRARRPGGEKLDTGSAGGELVLHVPGAIAHFERRPIAERMEDAVAVVRIRGKHPGRQLLDQNKVAGALKQAEAGLLPTVGAGRLGLGWSTVGQDLRKTAGSGVVFWHELPPSAGAHTAPAGSA